MRIRVSDPALVGNLLEYLTRCGCEAIQTGRDIVAASFPDPLAYDAARLELEFHLSEWPGARQGAGVVVLD